MEIFVPDMYQKGIEHINYDKLKQSGIKCLLFDLDNTLVPWNVKKPNETLKKLFDSLKKKGFKVIIFSNSGKKRLTPFKEELEVDIVPRALKPSPIKFEYVMKEYGFKDNEIAIIGDQFLTDIVGGNKAGVKTILITPVTKSDMIFTKINRMREKRLIKKLSRANLFYKGKYYE